MPDPDDFSLDDTDIRLFETGDLADATIVCGDRSWNVHKTILGSRCKWFKAAFYGNMAEATSGKVVLEEQDADLVEIMLRFIYAKEIDISELKNNKDIPTLCVQIFRVADFFMLNDLAQQAKTELNIHLTHKTRIYDKDSYSPEVSQLLAEVSDSIREAYKDSSTECLREILLRFLWMRKDRHLQAPEVITLLDDIPALGKDLMKVFLSIDPITNSPSKEPCPRDLPIIHAVFPPNLIYTAGGPAPKVGGNINVPCLLRPMRAMGDFEAVDPRTNDAIKELSSLQLYTPQIIEMTNSHDCGTVQVLYRDLHRNSLNVCYIQFTSPADANHYIKTCCNANPAIQEKWQSRAHLERVLFEAHIQVLDAQIWAHLRLNNAGANHPKFAGIMRDGLQDEPFEAH